jgi:hypothetical protein
MTAKHALAALALAAALIGAPGRAVALDVTLEVVAQEDPKKDLPADIVATVVSGSAAPPVEKISLIQTDSRKGPIEIKAVDLKTYAQGDESLGLVVLFQGHFLWIGDDSYSENDPKYEGVYKALTSALDKLNTAGPRGSRAALVSYGTGTQVRWAGDLKELTGDKIGTQATIGKVGNTPVVNRDLVAGVDEAIAQLNKLGTSRKVLLVIGDGVNTNHELGQSELTERRKKLAGDGIVAYAIFLQAPVDLEGDPNGFAKLTGNLRRLDSVDGLTSAISSVVDGIDDRYYVRFPGADLKLKRSFEWDTNPHAFALKIEKDEIDVDEILLAPKWVAPWLRKKGGFPWLGVILGVLGVGALIGVIVLLKNRASAAPAVVVPPPVVEAPAAPAAPAGPMKTVMIGVGGDDQGFPVVGWIVPLNGPNQFQTFKLQAGATKIGTGGPAHVVVNDGFMSTEHCQIVMSPAGFVLVDGGSTNGTYVNERKVDKHELVDNDVITMGKTSFRFKSIN